MIPLPRLYTRSGTFSRLLHPINVSLTLNMRPMSNASLDLPRGENVPARSYVEVYSPYGSAGMFRVRSPQDAYGDGTTAVELEHMISELGDYLVKEEISEMMAADAAVKKLFKYYKGKSWQLGSVAALGTGKVSLQLNYDNVLNGIMSILDQKTDCMLNFSFKTSPWTVSIVKKPTTVEAECRLARNVTEARISYDDSEMCTRAFYQIQKKNKDGETEAVWKSLDAPTISDYGVIERTVSTASDLTETEALRVAQTFLAEHQEPRVGVQIQGVELSDITGESMDKFAVGKLLRLAIPDDGINVEKNIRSLSWSNVYGDPRRVTVMIGDEEDTVVTFLHNIDSSGRSGGSRSGGGGSGTSEKQTMEYFKKYETQFNKSDTKIEILARENKDMNSILKQAGLELDRKGVLIYSSNSKTSLQGKLDVQNNRINLVVEGTGKNAKVNAAKIVAGINKRTGSFVKISASQINLTGYVTMKDFSATKGKVESLLSGKAFIAEVHAGPVYCSTAQIGSITIATHKCRFYRIVIDGIYYDLLGY